MTLLNAIIMGIIQGLTEFLPISSSAHLRLTPALLGFEDPGIGFTGVIQLGTVLAVLIYFGKDLWKALMGWVMSFTPEGKDTVEAKMGWAVFYGTIPVVIFGVLLKKKLHEESWRSLWVVAISMIVMGILMYAAERFSSKKRTEEKVTPMDAVVVGLFQCLALVPGMSRSGSTMTGAFFRQFDRPSAVRLSFLMSVPAVTAAGLFEFFDAKKELAQVGVTNTLIATGVSFIVGYACIAWLLKFISKSGVLVFSVYRVVLGLALIGLLSNGTLKPMSGDPQKPKSDVKSPN